MTTTEQRAIISATEDIILIKALAGCGKTTTLRLFAEAHATDRFLYLAYNKAAAEEAQGKFPPNVHVCTVHSLAYKRHGVAYAHKLGNNRANRIATQLRLDGDKQVERAKRALRAVEGWLTSSDENLAVYISTHHHSMKGDAQAELQADATALWMKMLDKSNTEITMPHDGYLKLFALSKPALDYDVVLLDEGQDSNAVTISLVQNIQCKRKVIVGDTYQAIYGFRGATNALAEFAKLGAATYTLNTTFRFNQVIADYATQVLQQLRGAADTRMIGGGASGEIVQYSNISELPQYTTVIGRSNYSLFQIALDEQEAGRKVYFAGGIERYDIEQLRAIIALYNERYVKHPFISKFPSYTALREYAQQSEENDLLFACFLVDRHGYRLGRMLEKLVETDKYVAADVAKRIFECHFQLVTAHRSKGLQFKRVALCDDFSKLYGMIDDGYAQRAAHGRLAQAELALWNEECNLYYVAVTRAMQVLALPRRLV